jgi:kynurenine formamidase
MGGLTMKRLPWIISMLLSFVAGMLVTHLFVASAQSPAPSLTAWDVVDLTQPLTSDIPIWPGDPEFEVEAWASYETDGYFINRVAIGEHSGTHWGTPNTFIEGARSAEMFGADELVVPAIVIDIREQAAEDEDYRLLVDDVEAWEAENNKVPFGSVVILFTGWQDRWDDPEAFINMDDEGVLHWPGFSAEAVEFLVGERDIVGIGTDTHGADPGNDEEFGASFAMYDADGMILENLAGLDELPPVGATLVIGGWPIEGGSGSPARIFAFLPPSD